MGKRGRSGEGEGALDSGHVGPEEGTTAAAPDKASPRRAVGSTESRSEGTMEQLMTTSVVGLFVLTSGEADQLESRDRPSTARSPRASRRCWTNTA